MAFPASNWFKLTVSDALLNVAAIDLNSDVIKCALYTNSVDGSGTINFDTNAGYAAAPWTANEVTESGTNYTTTGATCSSPTVTISPAGTLRFTAGYATWNSSTITARGCLLYDSTLATKYGIVAVSFGTSDVSSTNGTFEVRWNTNGILTFT